MTTKTYSIKELCARRNIVKLDGCRIEGRTLYGISKGEFVDLLGQKQSEHLIPILSINDLFPTDECETCHFERKDHTESMCPVYAKPRITEFKPRLARVVGIRMVERCECRHIKDKHLSELECITCENDRSTPIKICHKYKPVQEVEVEVEE